MMIAYKKRKATDVIDAKMLEAGQALIGMNNARTYTTDVGPSCPILPESSASAFELNAMKEELVNKDEIIRLVSKALYKADYTARNVQDEFGSAHEMNISDEVEAKLTEVVTRACIAEARTEEIGAQLKAHDVLVHRQGRLIKEKDEKLREIEQKRAEKAEMCLEETRSKLNETADKLKEKEEEMNSTVLKLSEAQARAKEAEKRASESEKKAHELEVQLKSTQAKMARNEAEFHTSMVVLEAATGFLKKSVTQLVGVILTQREQDDRTQDPLTLAKEILGPYCKYLPDN